jgi:hypothetical protein
MAIDMSQFKTLDDTGNVRQMTRDEVLALRPGVQLQFHPPKMAVPTTGEPLAEVELQLRNGLGEAVRESRSITLVVNQGEDQHNVTLDANGHATLQIGVVLGPGQHMVTVQDMPGAVLVIEAEVAARKVTDPNVTYLLVGKRALKLEQGEINDLDIEQATPEELRAILKWMLKQQQAK